MIHDALRHSAWASRTLLAVCRSVPREHLVAPAAAPGYGSILATFGHLVRSDGGYAAALGAPRPPWADHDEDESAEPDELERWIDEAAALWDELLGSPLDDERLLLLDHGAYEVHAGVVLAQALHHANIHREQICASLTALGVEAPDIQPWAYADATGRSRWVRPAASS